MNNTVELTELGLKMNRELTELEFNSICGTYL